MVWLKTVKFQADANYLACTKDLTTLIMTGRYKQPVQYRKRVRRALENHSSLGDYMYEILRRDGER